MEVAACPKFWNLQQVVKHAKPRKQIQNLALPYSKGQKQDLRKGWAEKNWRGMLTRPKLSTLNLLESGQPWARLKLGSLVESLNFR